MADTSVFPQIRQVAQAVRATAIKAGGKNTTVPAAPAAGAAPAAPAAAAPAPPSPPAEKKQ
jgi:hypothetical protein